MYAEESQHSKENFHQVSYFEAMRLYISYPNYGQVKGSGKGES